MLIVEKTNKIIPPSSVTFNFKSESYSFKWFVEDDGIYDEEEDYFVYRKIFVRDISHLLNLSLVNKHFYYFLFDNLFRLEISYNDDRKYNKTYEITMKRLFFIPDWISSYQRHIIKERKFQISEDHFTYIKAYYYNYESMIVGENGGGPDYCLTDMIVKEFILPKFLLNESFYSHEYNFYLKDINIYKSYHYLIKIEKNVRLDSIVIISLKDQREIRKIDGQGKIMKRFLRFYLLDTYNINKDNYFIYLKKNFFVFHYFDDIVLNVLIGLNDTKIIELLD